MFPHYCKHNMVKGAGTTTNNAKPADPVEGQGSAKNARNLDGAGTKAAKEDSKVRPTGSTTGMSKSGDPVDGSGSPKAAGNLSKTQGGDKK